jgi:alpha-N-arabinofuranosidase
MKKVLAILCLGFLLPAQAQVIDLKQTSPISPYIFGHNLEHTRSAVNGGLSAQMLKNRKFAAKPSASEGVAARWSGIGEKVFFECNGSAYTRHICLPNMRRINECNSQVIQNLKEGQTAGIVQYGLDIVDGRPYDLRTVTRVSKPIRLTVELTDRRGDMVYASQTLSLQPDKEWAKNEFQLTPAVADHDVAIRYTFSERAELTIGALSMMPHDNFHGMRSDVVALLKEIGPRLIRWPGGNFAGEYRWKDGLLPSDERAPMQSYTEIETQPHSDGYDFHEINTDDFIALCREVGAEPLLTINLAWNSPEESAQWVEYCNGAADTEYGKMRAERGHKEPYNVRFWSLGNEIGYGHMEGPKTPERYAEYAQRHSEAMLKVTPELELFSSGPYPNDNWASKSAAQLAEKVKYISLHGYYNPGRVGRHYTTDEEIRQTYEATVQSVYGMRRRAYSMRNCLNKTGKQLYISFDEWNQWYAWYRPSCVTDGIFTARALHFILNESDSLGMPVVCYFQPVGEGAILIKGHESRLTANGQMFAMMKAHQDGRLCKVTGNEDLSTAASLKDDVLTITLINDKYADERTFQFPVKGKLAEAVLYYADDLTPGSYFTTSELPVTVSKKDIKTTLPPHSVAIIRLQLKGKNY